MIIISTSMVHASLLSACFSRICSYQSMRFVRYMLHCPSLSYLIVYLYLGMFVSLCTRGRVSACTCVCICRYVFMCTCMHGMHEHISIFVSFCVCSNWAYISIYICMRMYIYSCKDSGMWGKTALTVGGPLGYHHF